MGGRSFGGTIHVPIVRAPEHSDIPYPAYATEGSAGVDLHAATTEPVSVARGEIVLVPTGLRVAIPSGFEGQVRPRSGLALRGLTLVNSPGTIDSDYRGEIKVILTCLANDPVQIHRGDRIAQLVLCPVGRAEFVPSESLPPSHRGEGGFGHTGVAMGDPSRCASPPGC